MSPNGNDEEFWRIDNELVTSFGVKLIIWDKQNRYFG